LGNQTDSALGSSATVDVGAALIENLILRGRITGGFSTSATTDFGYDAMYLFGMLGFGADWYIVPTNIRAGVSLGIAGLQLHHRDSPGTLVLHSKAGVAFDLDVAKEWWTGAEWGIGVGLFFRFMSVPPASIAPGSDGRLTVWMFGVQGAITYN
jgi:hypothetical protein